MTAADTFLEKWAEISALGSAASVLGWDQETHMPSKGQAARGRALAVLAGLHHDKMTDPALAEAIDRARADVGGDVTLAGQIREAEREVSRATAVPGAVTRRLAEVQSRALGTWQQARAASDFRAFAPVLSEVVALTRERAAALVDAGIAETPYDALLDGYEPGATEAQLAPLLDDLRSELGPLVRAVADSRVEIDESPTRGAFSSDSLRALGVAVAEAIGSDFEAGRLDLSAHPFTSTFGPGDVRITWRPDPGDFRPGLFGVMHEVGHAMYEQGLPADLIDTPLGESVSLGVHESQSRLWENHVGRSEAFWRWALPHLHEHLPSTSGVTVEALFPALHTVTPSVVRVEADEATYNLHIVARFEIERKIVAGAVEVADLPDLWDDTYESLLGVRPGTVADGVLQDIHWAMGAIGYFPTYALGNLIAAQLFEAATNDLGDLPARIAAGDFAPLLGWLRTHVHSHGRRMSAAELVESATGSPLTSDAFLRYVRDTTSQAYGVPLGV